MYGILKEIINLIFKMCRSNVAENFWRIYGDLACSGSAYF
jgi:hypothetical protein